MPIHNQRSSKPPRILLNLPDRIPHTTRPIHNLACARLSNILKDTLQLILRRFSFLYIEIEFRAFGFAADGMRRGLIFCCGCFGVGLGLFEKGYDAGGLGKGGLVEDGYDVFGTVLWKTG